MVSRSRSFIVIGLTCLGLLGPAAHVSHAQGLNGVIEAYYPAQLNPGQTTVLYLGMNGGRQNPVTALEITPSTGITYGAIKASEPHQGVVWFEIPVTLAKDAAPGKRALVAVQGANKTVPVDLTIPGKLPMISDFKVIAAPTNGPTVDFQFAANEPGGSFGDVTKVWFYLKCGRMGGPPPEPEFGVTNGKFANGIVRASIPNPRSIETTVNSAAAPSVSAKCDLELRATDSNKVDSNTITGTVEFK